MKNGVKNIQAAEYNGSQTIYGLRMEMPTYWRFIFYVCMGLINLTTHTFPLFFLGSDLLDLFSCKGGSD
jgi:hypothetical protein